MEKINVKELGKYEIYTGKAQDEPPKTRKGVQIVTTPLRALEAMHNRIKENVDFASAPNYFSAENSYFGYRHDASSGFLVNDSPGFTRTGNSNLNLLVVAGWMNYAHYNNSKIVGQYTFNPIFKNMKINEPESFYAEDLIEHLRPFAASIPRFFDLNKTLKNESAQIQALSEKVENSATRVANRKVDIVSSLSSVKFTLEATIWVEDSHTVAFNLTLRPEEKAGKIKYFIECEDFYEVVRETLRLEIKEVERYISECPDTLGKMVQV